MARTNLSALKATCSAICNTCYIDEDVAAEMLTAKDIDPDENVVSYPDIVAIAIRLVQGWVETSRSEGGISVSANLERLDKNIMAWCNDYGLDADEFLLSAKVIENGSELW